MTNNIDITKAVIVAALLGTKNFTIFEAQKYLDTLLEEARKIVWEAGYSQGKLDGIHSVNGEINLNVTQFKKERK